MTVYSAVRGHIKAHVLVPYYDPAAKCMKECIKLHEYPFDIEEN
jgi:hypothetical protein